MLMSCGIKNTSTEIAKESERVLKVGVLGPFTGPNALSGELIQTAVKMGFEEVNYTIGDYTIELVWIDSQSNPETGVKAYRKAIEEHDVQVGLLNWHSSVSVSVMDVVAEYKIPHFFTLGESSLVNRKFDDDPEKYKYWLKGWAEPDALNSSYVFAIEEAIAEGDWNPTAKRSFIIAENTDLGHSFSNSMQNYLQESDWTIVGTAYLPIDNDDFTAVLDEIQEKDTTLIVIVGGTFMLSFLKQRSQADITIPTITSILKSEWYDDIGQASNYLLTRRASFNPDKKDAFIKKLEKQSNSKLPADRVGVMYDYTNFLIRILEETYKLHDKLDSEVIAEFAEAKVFTGQFSYTDGVVMPEYKYTQDSLPDPVVGESYFFLSIAQFIDGEYYVIWPESRKESGFQIQSTTNRD